MKALTYLLFALLLWGSLTFSKETGFTQEDRERLIRLETTLRVFMEQTNKRFEDLRNDMNKRFEQMDRRITELREDMNKRFEQVDKRFEQVDKRFEQINNELNRLVNIMVGIFAGQIALVVAVIGFAYWDRRTIIRKAREDTIEYLEREGKLRKLVEALREKAKTDKELEAILKKYGLM